MKMIQSEILGELKKDLDKNFYHRQNNEGKIQKPRQKINPIKLELALVDEDDD